MKTFLNCLSHIVIYCFIGVIFVDYLISSVLVIDSYRIHSVNLFIYLRYRCACKLVFFSDARARIR